LYDEEHVITYLRLLDADAKGGDWREVARIVLHPDPDRESDRATGKRRLCTAHANPRHFIRSLRLHAKVGSAGEKIEANLFAVLRLTTNSK